jgi:hypothetical protein
MHPRSIRIILDLIGVLWQIDMDQAWHGPARFQTDLIAFNRRDDLNFEYPAIWTPAN